MMTLVCFLEELSAQVFLEGIFPRLLPGDIHVVYVVFEGKSDLEKQLMKKSRNWKKPNSVFLVMRDQDSSDCKDVKSALVELCKEAGKPETMVRIACRELESFYFGDLQAVEKALCIGSIASYKNKSRYRNPDIIISPSHELEKITRRVYQKVSGSREIGKILSLESNISLSYNALLAGIKKLCGLEDK